MAISMQQQSGNRAFSWPIAHMGHEWSVDSKKQYVLEAVGRDYKYYNPMQRPALFRELATLPVFEDVQADIRRKTFRLFADRFGLLAPDFTVDDWRWSAIDMAVATRVWDQLRHEDNQSLLRRVVVHSCDLSSDITRFISLIIYGKTDHYGQMHSPGTPAVALAYWSGERIEDRNSINVDDLSDLDHGDSHVFEIVPAGENEIVSCYREGTLDVRPLIRERVLRATVNRHLRQSTDHPYVGTHSRTGDDAVMLWPKHLLGALWIQLATAICEGREQYQCATCGGWFEAARRTRSNVQSRFCSATCRTRAHRARVETAVRMHREEKKDPKEIAKELDVKVGQVRDWLKKAKEK